MPDVHSRLSPSSMARVLLCPGSAVDNPPDNGSAAADEGTLAHSFCEKLLLKQPVSERDWPNQEMKEGVQEFVKYVKSYMAQHESKLRVEIRMESKRIPDHGGTVDALLVSEDVLHVIDFKYGVKPVHSENNKQLLSYLVLADEMFPGRTKFYASIVQPRVFGDNVCAEYTREQLDSHLFDVTMAADDKSINPGEHCNWYCPLLKTCKAVQEKARQAAKTAFDDDWDSKKCLEIIEISSVVSKLKKEADKRLTSILKNGEPVDGWKLVRQLGNREWTDVEKVLEEFPEEVIYEQKVRSPKQVEDFSKAYAAIVADLTRRPERGVIAAPSTSKLPEYNPQGEFDVIE